MWLGVPLSVIFTRATREPVHSTGVAPPVR